MENYYPISEVNSNWAYPILEPADIETRFLELAQQWRRETGMMSLVTKMSMHPAYQRIKGELTLQKAAYHTIILLSLIGCCQQNRQANGG